MRDLRLQFLVNGKKVLFNLRYFPVNFMEVILTLKGHLTSHHVQTFIINSLSVIISIAQ